MKSMKKSLYIFGLIICVILCRYLFAPVFERMELVSYDLRSKIALDGQQFMGKFAPLDKKNIVIIEIDDYSRNQLSKNPQLNLGPWPWRRDVWSGVVKMIERGEPKAILFDLIFADNATVNSYQDTKLSWVLRSYDNVFVGTALNHPKYLVDQYKTKDLIDDSDFLPTDKSLDVFVESKKVDDNITYYSHSPISDIYTEYTPTAVLNRVDSKDNVLRQHQPLFKLIKGDKTYYIPSLAFAGFLKAMGDDGQIILQKDKIVYKNRVIPINEKGATNISWHGKKHNYEFIPISKLLIDYKNDPNFDSSCFKDKIVLIGRTETGSDVHHTSVSPSYLGTETVATALDNMLNDTNPENIYARKFVQPIPTYVEFIITMLFCLLIVIVGLTSVIPFMGLLNGILILVLYIIGCVIVFVAPSLRFWIPVVVPIYYILSTATIFYAFRLHKETSQKTEIMNVFGKFVSPTVLSTLLASADNLVLKSSKKRITVMFCDVKDFTTLSEKSDPQQLVENINELFNEIVKIVFENNGTVDKFVGDCVMAYWGDPMASDDDAYMAVKTALEIKKRINEIKLSNIKEGKIVFDVKIGINTGDALLGLVGSERLMSYTAMGDAVNVAARLESSCSKLKRDVLIAKSTFEEVKDKVVTLNVGTISVKGKDEQIEVYEPISFVPDVVQDTPVKNDD